MNISKRRVSAIFRKELREYRHNGTIVSTMAIIPLIFVLPPLIDVFAQPASSAIALRHGDALLYLLRIPAIVPAVVAAYAVVGERQQGTLEPVLTTPVLREEFLLGTGGPRPLACHLLRGLRLRSRLRRALRTPSRGLSAPARPGAARPATLHPAPRHVVDLGRHRDLRPIARRPRRPAARHAREPPVGRGDIVHPTT